MKEINVNVKEVCQMSRENLIKLVFDLDLERHSLKTQLEIHKGILNNFKILEEK